MSKSPMLVESAERVYDVLVDKCGAPERQRAHFVHAQSSEDVVEWRFQGSLGFGGKFWRNSGSRPDGSWGECWYVNCYPEDRTTTRDVAAREANDALWPLLLAEEASR